MNIEPIAGLTLIMQIVDRVVKSIRTMRGTPKQRFARTVIGLFGILDELAISLSKVLSELSNLKAKSPEELRSSDFAKLVGSIAALNYECDNFVEWMKWQVKWLKIVDFLWPEVFHALADLLGTDVTISRREERLQRELSESLQLTDAELVKLDFWSAAHHIGSNKTTAIRSGETLRAVIDGADAPFAFLQEAVLQVNDAKEKIRAYMVANIHVEDLF